MLRIRILANHRVWLDRTASRAAILAALEEIKWHLARVKDHHFAVVCDDGEIYSILWRT